MRSKIVVCSSLALLAGLMVSSCTASPRQRDNVGEDRDSEEVHPLHEHTNPPIVLKRGGSPPKWLRGRKFWLARVMPPDPNLKIFEGDTCGASEVLNYSSIGAGTKEFKGEYANGHQIDDWSSKPFRITGVFDGAEYRLVMTLTADGNSFQMVRKKDGKEVSCDLTYADKDPDEHLKTPLEFSYLDDRQVFHEVEGGDKPVRLPIKFKTFAE